MSPAVGQQNIPMPPRPSSSQSDGSGPTRMSHSPMNTQSNYQQHLGPPPHMGHAGYKMGGHPGMVSASGQQMGLYNSPGQQYPIAGGGGSGGYVGAGAGGRPQGNLQYSAAGQNYAPPVSSTQPQGPVTNNMPGAGAGAGTGTVPYPGRPILNHVSHSQFPAYQQSWSSSGPTMSTPTSGKGTAAGSIPGTGGISAMSQAPCNMTQSNNAVGTNVSSARPPHYLKQHLQHKIGFGSSGSNVGNVPPSPGSLQGYNASTGGPPGMGPPMHQHSNLSMGPPIGSSAPGGYQQPAMNQGMGPPSSMGPPNMVPSSSTGAAVGTSAPPLMQQMSNNHDGSPIMPPPSSTPNSHSSMHSLATTNSSYETGTEMLDNGITTTATGNMVTHVTSAAGGSVTSVVTTGPDGTTLDEGSQQSTLSNTSAGMSTLQSHTITLQHARSNNLMLGIIVAKVPVDVTIPYLTTTAR